MDKELKHDLQHVPKEITLTLDKKRTYRLDLNAYAELDMKYEDKTYHHIEADLLKMRPYAVRDFLWAGLVHEDRELTPEYVGKFIDVHNVQEYSKIIYELILGDTPKSKAKKKNESNVTNDKKK